MHIRIEVQTESVRITQLVWITNDYNAVTVRRGWGIGVSGQHSQPQSLFIFNRQPFVRLVLIPN